MKSFRFSFHFVSQTTVSHKKHIWNDLSSFFEKNYEQEAYNPCETRRHAQESLGPSQYFVRLQYGIKTFTSSPQSIGRALFLHVIHSINQVTRRSTPSLQQDAMGAYTSTSWLWINCECGGIVNDIVPDTIPHKYPYFSPFV